MRQRAWAWLDKPLPNRLKWCAGVYDEATRVGMDYVIQQASQRGIRLVLVLANYWAMYGGIDQYNIWSFQAGSGAPCGPRQHRFRFDIGPVQHLVLPGRQRCALRAAPVQGFLGLASDQYTSGRSRPAAVRNCGPRQHRF